MFKKMIGFMSESRAEEYDLATRPSGFPGIVQYVYAVIDDSHTASFKRASMFDIDWDEAERNTFAETEVIPMSEMLGLPEELGVRIWIVTNKSKFRGASSIMNKAALKEKLGGGRYVMLPSSIHEVLLYPDDGNELSEFVKMVTEINRSEVAPEERLTDNAFFITL